jgi:hypothetical protein
MIGLDQWRTTIKQVYAPPPPSKIPQLPAAGDQVAPSDPPTSTALGLTATTTEFNADRQTHVIMVNSLDRDQKVFPLPTQVRLKLPRVYRNVAAIDIVQVKFFCGLYAISAARKNNGLWVTDISGTRQVTVADGTYTLQQLLARLATALSTGSSLTYTASWNPTAGRVTIAATGTFSLLFQSKLPVYNQSAYSEWGLGWNLGFGGQPADLSGSTITATYWPRLTDDFLYLQLNLGHANTTLQT